MWRRSTLTLGTALVAAAIAGPAQAAPFTLGPVSAASGLSPFAPG
jgi:hypothetical protein